MRAKVLKAIRELKEEQGKQVFSEYLKNRYVDNDKTASFWGGFEKQSRELSSKARNNLPDSAFVFPKERRYPIHDRAHARNALARVAQHGTPEEERAVKQAVKSRYPDVGE